MSQAKAQTFKSKGRKLVRENYGGDVYEYYPLGKYVVAAPGVCGGRPTFKYTRLEVSVILILIASGVTIEDAVRRYSLSKISSQAVKEAIKLASQTLEASALALQPAA